MSDMFSDIERIASDARRDREKVEAMFRNRAVGNVSALYGQSAVIHEGPHDIGAFMAAPAGQPAMPLGCNAPGSATGLAWPILGLLGHGLTFGVTRSGKGVCSIIPALLTYSGSMVVIDPKGENAWVTAERRRQMGQRVVILDPWNEVNRRYAEGRTAEQVTRFNPLSALRADDQDFSDDIAALADALIIATPGGHDAHWTESARELVAGLIAAEVERKPPGKASLGQVRRLLTASDEELAEAVTLLHERDPDSLAGRKLRRFTKSTNEVAGIRSTAETQTAILDNARLADAMETGDPPFDLAELATGKVTLYLVLPLDRLQTHGRWLRLILTLAIRAIARQAAIPALPVVFLLDEMGTIGRLSMIEQAYGLMAGVGIRLWGFLQDLNQLKRDYPDSWETFISNSSLIQVLKVGDITTSDYVSSLLGTKTQERISAETAKLRQEGFLKAANPNASLMSDQVFSRAVLLPQEVRSLNKDFLINIFPGLGNYLMYRIPYFDRDEWIDRYRPLPGRAMKARPPAPPQPKKPEPVFDTQRAAEIAAQGVAAGKAVMGKASAWISKRNNPENPPSKPEEKPPA